MRSETPNINVFLTSSRSINVPTIGPRSNIGAPRQKASNATEGGEMLHRYAGTVNIRKISSHSARLDNAWTTTSSREALNVLTRLLMRLYDEFLNVVALAKCPGARNGKIVEYCCQWKRLRCCAFRFYIL